MGMGPLKIALMAAAMAAVVVLSCVVRYHCKRLPSPFAPGRGKLAIIVSNEQEAGEDMDLAGGGHVELRCHGYSEYNRSRPWWSARTTIGSGRQARLTLPAVRGDEIFEVFCSYRGANLCWAHGVKVFGNPGHDNLFCGEGVGGCTIKFRRDGGVEKQYQPAAARREAQPPVFLGFVPDFDNARDGQCASTGCVGRKLSRVIGQVSCCDDSCGGWEKAMPARSVI